MGDLIGIAAVDLLQRENAQLHAHASFAEKPGFCRAFSHFFVMTSRPPR